MTSDDAHLTKIGFLGLGALGAPIAARLAARNPVAVFDPDPGRRLPDPEGVAYLASPREVADHADIIFACLAERQHHQEALLGSEGIVHGRRRRLYVHLGTSGSLFLEELDRQLAAAGIATIDAPVTGGPPKARSGELTTIVSGEPVGVATVRDAIMRYSNRIVVAGERPGQAQTLKLVNNAIALTNLVAACEAMVVGARCGIDAETMLEVINNGSGQSRVTLSKLPDHVLPRSFDFGATLAVVIKDLELFLAEPGTRSMLTDTCRSALDAFRRARDVSGEHDHLSQAPTPGDVAIDR